MADFWEKAFDEVLSKIAPEDKEKRRKFLEIQTRIARLRAEGEVEIKNALAEFRTQTGSQESANEVVVKRTPTGDEEHEQFLVQFDEHSEALSKIVAALKRING